MIQQLIILGILQQGPSSGYDIKKIINKELSPFASLVSQSIYYPLQQMEKKSLVKKEKVMYIKGKQRKIYSITKKGQIYFKKIVKTIILSQKSPFMEFDIPLYFIDLLPVREVLPLLRLRSRFLIKASKWLNDYQKKPVSPRQILIINHRIKLIKAEQYFLRQLVRNLQSKGQK